MVTTGARQETVALENGALKLVVRADLGGRIDQFLDEETGRDWVWHPASYNPGEGRELPIGAGFDDAWQGGWDEVFPNDMAQSFQGRNLVDHGELWSQAWDVLESTSLSVKLGYSCQTVPVRVEKTITLAEAAPEVRVEYCLQNLSNEKVPFLLKLHAAIAIEETDQILLPDCDIEPVTLDFSTIIGRHEKTRFPQAFAADGSEIDLRQIPATNSRLQEFYYSSNLAIGACGIKDGRGHASLKMRFDTAEFPYVWMFQSYGGWRDHYVLVMEPCTTLPYDLELAVQNGTAAVLEANEVQRRSLTISLESF